MDGRRQPEGPNNTICHNGQHQITETDSQIFINKIGIGKFAEIIVISANFPILPNLGDGHLSMLCSSLCLVLSNVYTSDIGCRKYLLPPSLPLLYVMESCNIQSGKLENEQVAELRAFNELSEILTNIVSQIINIRVRPRGNFIFYISQLGQLERVIIISFVLYYKWTDEMEVTGVKSLQINVSDF